MYMRHFVFFGYICLYWLPVYKVKEQADLYVR